MLPGKKSSSPSSLIRNVDRNKKDDSRLDIKPVYLRIAFLHLSNDSKKVVDTPPTLIGTGDSNQKLGP